MKGLRLDAGVSVTIGKRPANIVRVLDLDSYLVRFENEEHRVVGRKDIDDPRSVGTPIRALDDYTPEETSEAYRWWEVLKPLLTGSIPRGEKSNFMVEAGQILGVDRATVYRRVTGYNGTVMSLLPKGGQSVSCRSTGSAGWFPPCVNLRADVYCRSGSLERHAECRQLEGAWKMRVAASTRSASRSESPPAPR